MESLVRISNNWALWPFRQLFTCAVERFYQTVLGKIVNNLLSRTLPLFPEVEEWGLRTMNMITYLKVYTKLRWNEGRSIAYFTLYIASDPLCRVWFVYNQGKTDLLGMYLVVDKTCQKLPSKSCVVDIVERQDCGIVSKHVCMLFRKSIAFVQVSYFVIVR